MNFFKHNNSIGLYSQDQLLELSIDPRMRWMEDAKGQRVLQMALKFPRSESLQRRASNIARRRAVHASTINDPFLANYPSHGSLPHSQQGSIRLALLPTGEWLSIPLEALSRGMLVCGPAGGGKSNFLRGTIPQILSAGGNVIAFDRKGKAELIDSSFLMRSGQPIHVWQWHELKLAPFESVEGIPLNYWANLIVSLLSSQWSIIGSSRVLMEIVNEFYSENGAKTWDRLLGKAVQFKPESFRSQQYRDVLIRCLKSDLVSLGEVINYERSNFVELISQSRGQCHVVLTDGLPPDKASLLSALIVTREYEYRRVNPEAQKQIAVYILDDSMALLRKHSADQTEGVTINPLNTIAFMGRSLGIGLVPSVQNFSQLSDFFALNCDTIVVCGSYGEDAYQLSRLMNLTKEQAVYLSQMRPGEIAVLARSVWQQCVLGQYPLIR